MLGGASGQRQIRAGARCGSGGCARLRAVLTRLLLIVLCVIAAPAATLASTLCCAAADACCDDPCAADESPAADDHCTLSVSASTAGTLSPTPDTAPVLHPVAAAVPATGFAARLLTRPACGIPAAHSSRKTPLRN